MWRYYVTKKNREEEEKKRLNPFLILFFVFLLIFSGANEWFEKHDEILSIISFIIIAIWFIFLLKTYKLPKKRKLRDLVFYEPPKDFTAAEIAVIDEWGSTSKVFSAMLYDWVAQKNVKIGRLSNGELFFEKLTDNPFFFSDTKYLYVQHSAYNKDPEHDFWNLCFPQNRTRVTMRMLSRIPGIDKIPQDFFYQAQRQCVDWEKYKKERRNPLTVSFEISLLIPFCIGCILVAALLNLIFMYILGLGFVVRIVVLLWKQNSGDKLCYLTDKGAKALEEIQGFRKYLYSVEDNKLKIVLKEDPTYFEKILPYAIAVGAGDGWINKCFSHLQYDEYGGSVYTQNISRSRITLSEIEKYKKGMVDSISFLNSISVNNETFRDMVKNSEKNLKNKI